MDYEPDFEKHVAKGKKFIMIAGCSGSGKTTLVKGLKSSDPECYNLDYDGYTFAVVFPKFNVVAMGRYRDDLKTCGCDTLKGKENILQALLFVWNSDWDIIVEGLYTGNAGTFKRAEGVAKHLGKRDYYVYSLMLDEKIALDRVQKRSGRTNHNLDPLYTLNKRSREFDSFLNRNCPELKFKYRLVDTGKLSKEEVLDEFKKFIGIGII